MICLYIKRHLVINGMNNKKDIKEGLLDCYFCKYFDGVRTCDLYSHRIPFEIWFLKQACNKRISLDVVLMKKIKNKIITVDEYLRQKETE